MILYNSSLIYGYLTQNHANWRHHQFRATLVGCSQPISEHSLTCYSHYPDSPHIQGARSFVPSPLVVVLPLFDSRECEHQAARRRYELTNGNFSIIGLLPILFVGLNSYRIIDSPRAAPSFYHFLAALSRFPGHMRLLRPPVQPRCPPSSHFRRRNLPPPRFLSAIAVATLPPTRPPASGVRNVYILS